MDANHKEQFLRAQLWNSTIGAGFQRANVYNSTATNNDKKELRSYLFAQVNNLLPLYNKSKVSDAQHIENIIHLQNASKTFHTILNNEQLSFGVAQKLLNLYLKYLWCMNLINEPPHFPVDRIIQVELGIPQNSITPWTTSLNTKNYLSIIEKARTQASLKNCTIAQLELYLYNDK